jgi:hypothetical protein
MAQSISKRITILKRKVGMTFEQFRDYYENKHAKLVVSASRAAVQTPQRLYYSRRYIHPLITDSLDESTPEFDVLAEVWYKTRAEMDLSMRPYRDDPQFRRIMVEDEERLFDRRYMQFYAASDECGEGWDTSAGQPASALKLIQLCKRRQGEPPSILPGAQRYRRMDLEPLTEYSTSSEEDTYDSLVEVCYGSRGDLEVALQGYREAVARRGSPAGGHPDVGIAGAQIYGIRDETLSDLS